MGKFSRGAVLLTSCVFAAITGKFRKFATFFFCVQQEVETDGRFQNSYCDVCVCDVVGIRSRISFFVLITRM